MTDKFTIVNMGLNGRFIKENGKIMEIERVVDLLNNYEKECEQLKSENQHIKNTIAEAYTNERTALGKSVLKQLLNNIGEI